GEHLGIGAALRFCHRETGDDLIVEQRNEIAVFLLLGAIVSEDFGVTRIRGLTAEHRGSEPRTPKDLVDQCKLDLAVSPSAQFGAEMACPEAALLDLALQGTDQCIALRILDLIGKAKDVIERLDLLLHELID